MTLFRKVFQSQSRPATEDEQIDEEALRAAFTAMDAAGHPLVLDPFAHAVSDGTDGADDNGGKAESVQGVNAPVADQSEDHVNAIEDQDIYDEDTFVHRTREEQVETQLGQAKAPEYAQSDEEIAACLDRALATDVVVDDAETPDADLDEVVVKSIGQVGTDNLMTGEKDAGPSGFEVGEPVPEADIDAAADLDFSDPASAANKDMRMLQLVAEAHGAVDAEKTEPTEISEDRVSGEAEGEAAGTDTDAAVELDNLPGDAPDTQFKSAQESIPLSDEPVTSDVAADNSTRPDATAALDLSNAAALVAVPAPATGRASRRANRAKTRLLGFNRGAENDADPFRQTSETTATAQRERFPVGWLVIVEGPGVGHAFSLFAGASMIGRGEDQVIRLDFGDNAISRQNHAAIAYDEEQNKFYLGHGGKSNIIRRNARPVLSTEELHHADLIRIGETTLRFVALCGSDFQWQTTEAVDAAPV